MTKLASFQTLTQGFVLMTSFPSIMSCYCAFGGPELREVGTRGSAARAIILTKGRASRVFPQSAGRGSWLLMIPVLQFQALLPSLLSCSSKVVWRRNWSHGWAWCVYSNHLWGVLKEEISLEAQLVTVRCHLQSIAFNKIGKPTKIWLNWL